MTDCTFTSGKKIKIIKKTPHTTTPITSSLQSKTPEYKNKQTAKNNNNKMPPKKLLKLHDFQLTVGFWGNY